MGNLVFQATLGGQVNLVGPNTASTFNLNVPAIAGTLVTTGDTGTVTNTMCATSVYTAPGTIGSGTPNTGSFTTLAASSTVTLSGGTANGVAYLNGSKVLTTGSALVFDGTNLGLGVVPSAWSQGKTTEIGAVGNGVWAYSGVTRLMENAYFNSGYKYAATGVAAAYMSLDGGTFNWNTTGTTTGTAGTTAIFTQAMTLDASGNLGIGISSPGQKLHVDNTANSTTWAKISNGNSGSGAASGVLIGTDQGDAGALSQNSSNAGYGTAANALRLRNLLNAPLLFETNGSERARIDSSGNLLVGTTSGTAYRMQVIANGTNTALFKTDGAYAPVDYWQANTTGNNPLVQFYTETSATLRGSITYNRGAGQVAYNVTSDYRSKTVNGLVQNALSKVAELKPSTGRMNGAEFDIDFFVAHELQEVVPSAVTGEKDAVNEDGTPKYQMVDKSALIPLLTAAIQELKAIVDAQAVEIASLKG